MNSIHVPVKHMGTGRYGHDVNSSTAYPMARKGKSSRRLGKHFLREWRVYRELTQEQAAGRLDVDRSMLSKIENYRAQYTQELLEKASIAYDCTVEDLLAVNPGYRDPPRLIYDSLRNASAEQQRRALAIIDSLLKAG